MRKYRAIWYHGDEVSELEFYSIYRAGSKANFKDFKDTYFRKFGHLFKGELIQIYLVEKEMF